MSVSIRHQARRRLWPSNCTRWKYLNYYRICSRLHTLICRPDTNIFPNFISPANLFRPFSAVGKVTASYTPPRNGPYICTERKRKGRINLLAWHVPPGLYSGLALLTPDSYHWSFGQLSFVGLWKIPLGGHSLQRRSSNSWAEILIINHQAMQRDLRSNAAW